MFKLKVQNFNQSFANSNQNILEKENLKFNNANEILKEAMKIVSTSKGDY